MRLLTAALVSAAFIAAWAAVAWLVMLVTLYVVRLIPMTGWRSRDREHTTPQSVAKEPIPEAALKGAPHIDSR